MNLDKIIAVAHGDIAADVTIKNGQVIDVFTGRIQSVDVAITCGKIAGLGTYEGETEIDAEGMFVAPGFIDAHVHIESSMASVSEFARTVLACGTSTVIADPHEIANVHGTLGLDYMLACAEGQPVNIYYALSSCVPATDFETSGAQLKAKDLTPYLQHDRIIALAEMMNFPGVIARDPEVVAKLDASHRAGKPIDGHAPGLLGKDLNAYCAAGVRSDHECTTVEEAFEKLTCGMYIMIRQGTAARNLETLAAIINPITASRLMWCTDDRHPHDLLEEGHIDAIIREAIGLGVDPVTAIRMATLNPATYFNLNHLGAVAPGFQADLVLFPDLSLPKAEMVIHKGEVRVRNGQLAPHIPEPKAVTYPPSMNVQTEALDFSIPAEGDKIRVMVLVEDQIITRQVNISPNVRNDHVVSDIDRDILKIGVVERHHNTGRIGLGFVRGFKLQYGALASSVGHDSHNIIVVGATDRAMKKAVEMVISMGGGMVATDESAPIASLALPIAGLMSPSPMDNIADGINMLLQSARNMGCKLKDPFMTLSFLALPVIPELKITDHGLFDLSRFDWVPLFVDEEGDENDK